LLGLKTSSCVALIYFYQSSNTFNAIGKNIHYSRHFEFFFALLPISTMNVLFHTFWYPYNGSVDGVFVKEHARSYKTTGGNIAVQAIKILPCKSVFKIENEFVVDEGIPTYYLVVKSVFWKFIYVNIPLLYLLSKRHYIKVISKNFIPDIIVSNVVNPAGITGHWLSKYINCKHVIIEHWSRIPKFMRYNIFAKSAKNAYNNASSIVTVSNYLKESVLKYAATADRIFVIPNVIDSAEFYFKEKQPSNSLVFCFIAGLNYPKKPDIVAKALDIVAKETGKPIVLNIIGAGPYRAELEILAATLCYKVNFLGLLSKRDLANELRKADYLLHATLFETFALVVAEAICTGTPVCASDVPQINKLINNDIAVLCDNTVEDWVWGIKQLMVKDHSNIDATSRDFHSRFSKEAVGLQLKLLFDKVVSV
jgi:glycosyltransferase involved in cell wall biosynthesis